MFVLLITKRFQRMDTCFKADRFLPALDRETRNSYVLPSNKL
jgi:hypothetical protein